MACVPCRFAPAHHHSQHVQSTSSERPPHKYCQDHQGHYCLIQWCNSRLRLIAGFAGAVREKVRLYARVGAAVISARGAKREAFDAIPAVLTWDCFREAVAEAESPARSEEFDAYQMLGEHYPGIRRCSPAFLATLTFQGVPAASLLRAMDVLRAMNSTLVPGLPRSVPTGFSGSAAHDICAARRRNRPALLRTVRTVGTSRSAACTGCMGGRQPALSLLRGPAHPRETLRELEQSGKLPVAVDADFEPFIAARRTLLH